LQERHLKLVEAERRL